MTSYEEVLQCCVPDDGNKSGFYRNERWQPRGSHPQAPPKLTAAQRRARGPLPDWDECATAEDDSFDYMDLMEAQWAQYFTMATMPSFDPTAAAIEPLPFSNMLPFSVGLLVTAKSHFEVLWQRIIIKKIYSTNSES